MAEKKTRARRRENRGMLSFGERPTEKVLTARARDPAPTTPVENPLHYTEEVGATLGGRRPAAGQVPA